MSNPKNYTVGWICAISTEYVAAQAFLDEKHEGPEYVSPHDHNDYTLGRIGKHNVVIAVLPEGEYGVSSAATVARDMLHSFPNVRIGLMVGIGGGAPSRKHDIRLGDIVVSAPCDGKGGVFQYDFGKTIQDQNFRPTGFLDQPPTVLRTALSGLKAQYESEGHRLEASINVILEEKPRLKGKYKRPDPGCDRLFRSEIIHPSDPEGNCAEVCNNNPSNLAPRPERTQNEDNPTIQYGLIASANQLMKNALIRDRLAAEKDVLCFEMEAAGLMNHFPCLIIRGICDYSDSHKNKEWQGYAAMAAAGYAKDLLCRIPPNRVEAEKKIGDLISDVFSNVAKTANKIENLVSKSDRNDDLEILNWLTPVDYAPQQNDFISRRQKGTCQWLLNSNQFRDWVNQRNRTLFCPGIPGAGKTVSAAIVINELYSRFSNDASVGVSYVYCNFRRQHDQKLIDLLASLLKQIVQGLPSVPESVKSFHKQYQDKRRRPSIDDVSQALQFVIRDCSKVFIIIDALDECQVSDGGRKQFLTELFNLQAKTSANLFVTSRFIPEIEKEFDGKSTRLEICANNDDLQRYLDGHMMKLPSFVSCNADLREEIKTAIIKTVDGMFLLAQLHLDSLIGKSTPKAVKNALKRLPKGSEAYDQAYREVMKRIEVQVPDSKILAKQVLSWIICAKRPLTTLELQHALAVEVGESELDNENLPDTEDMVSVCAGLVTVDRESNIIRLVHYTTQEFFERTQRQWFPKAEEDIANICITYLSFDVFGSGFYMSDEEFEAQLRSNPLYSYAAQNWGHHLRDSDTHGASTEFIWNEAKVSAASQALMVASEYRPGYYSQRVPRQISGIHLAAWFGLAELVDRLVKDGQDSDCKDSDGQTPLSYAARNGHEVVVRLLVARADVEVNSKDEYGEMALSMAAANGHEAVVRLLVAQADVKINSQDIYGRTALWWTARNGHKKVIELLLARADIDVNLKNNDFIYHGTALLIAAANGHDTVVKLLLARADTEINSEDKYGRTALSVAAARGHETVVELLLARADVEINSKDNYGRTALSAAMRNGYPAVIKLLVARADVKVNSKDNCGRPALWWAAKDGHKTMVELLLARADVKINLKDKDNRTALWWAAKNGHKTIVELLLARADVEVNSKDNSGQTALSWVARNGHEAIIELLLTRAGVEVNSKDKDSYGGMALWWAVRNGHEAVIKLLLARADVEVNFKDKKGQTALWWAARNEHEAIVELLLARADVKVNSKHECDETLLLWTAKNGYKTVVKLLLTRADIEVNWKDNNGRSALWWAAKNGHETVIELLLARADVEINLKDKYGRTALSWTAAKGHTAAMRLLLARADIEVNLKDKYGRTALSWATMKGHKAVVRLLKSKNTP